MCLPILSTNIVRIICANQLNSSFLRHTKKVRINDGIVTQTMILHFQEVISFTENISVFQCNLLCLIIKTSSQIKCHLALKTG